MQLLGTGSELLVDLLKSHGIAALHDGGIVTLVDYKHRFVLQVYKSGDKSVLLEAMCRLENGQLMTERLAGVGETQEQAVMDAQINFVGAVFHVWLAALLGKSNKHTSEYIWQVNGTERKVTIGFPSERGGGCNEVEWQKEWHLSLQRLALSPGLHWASLCYVRHSDKFIACDALLDNEVCESVEEKMLKFDWPVRDGLYSVRQFIVISDGVA